MALCGLVGSFIEGGAEAWPDGVVPDFLTGEAHLRIDFVMDSVSWLDSRLDTEGLGPEI